MRKSCRSCKFLINYGGNEYDCSKKSDCPIRDMDIETVDYCIIDGEVKVKDPFTRVSFRKTNYFINEE
jgi:hypothetical protein